MNDPKLVILRTNSSPIVQPHHTFPAILVILHHRVQNNVNNVVVSVYYMSLWHNTSVKYTYIHLNALSFSSFSIISLIFSFFFPRFLIVLIMLSNRFRIINKYWFLFFSMIMETKRKKILEQLTSDMQMCVPLILFHIVFSEVHCRRTVEKRYLGGLILNCWFTEELVVIFAG